MYYLLNASLILSKIRTKRLEATSGNKYIILFLCKFSLFVVAVPVPNLRALTVAIAFVEKILLTYRPTVLTSDFGTEYKNSLVKSIATVAKIKHIFSPPYHHESNGSAERANLLKTIC